LDPYFAAHDQFYPGFLRGLPSAHDASQGALICDRQGAIVQPCRTLEQLLRTGRTALEAEVRQAMQFGIIAHANQPCSSNGPSLLTSRYAQPRCPAQVCTT